jgi:3-hydroxyacyl-CoA dehydrogenase
VACADRPAFVVNRVLTRLMSACVRTVREPDDFARVDDAMTALGLPMGTFELLGLVGLEVAAHVADTLSDAFPDRFPVDENFRMLGASGLDGVYDPDAEGRRPHQQIVDAWQVDESVEARTTEQIQRFALEACADEIRHMLDEGVVDDPRDIDTCMLLGAGWPFFNGGICMYLDQTGVSTRRFGRPLLLSSAAG